MNISKKTMKKFLASLFVATSLSISPMTFSDAIAQQTSNYNLPDFTGLVAKYGNTVVNISTTTISKNNGGNFQFDFGDSDDPALELFKHFFNQIPGGGGNFPREQQNHSLGSGFIISSDGYILTNAHVVAEADEIKVRLNNDKKEFTAKVIGSDKRTDIALIKIEATGLPVVKLANVKNLKVGEWVVAIGSPFGFDNSVTAGIVSAKGRSLPQENYVPFIQTDVAINPGNSGGPLFNLRGEVVGINSQIYSRSGGYMGVSFAIPIDVAMQIQKQLRQSGKVNRGRLGVSIQELTQELAENFGLRKPLGALVNSVEKNGPSGKILLPGDIIMKYNDEIINTAADLPRLVGQTEPNTKVVLTIWRGGKLYTANIVIGKIDDDENFGKRQSNNNKSEGQAIGKLGLVLSPLTASQKNALQVPHGLVIENIRGNLGKQSGLLPGDVILALIYKGETFNAVSVKALADKLASLPKNSSFTFLIRRQDDQIFLNIKNY